MSHLLSVATAVPAHRYAQAELKEAACNVFPPEMLPIFDHAGIDQRYLCFPVEYYLAGHDFERRNRDYVQQAVDLGSRAAEAALAKIDPRRIAHLLFVTTTGLATPSIDAHLINRLPLSPHIKRTPIFGVGCAGGAVGLARAKDLATDDLALLVSVELCGQTFDIRDRSNTNLVGAALFGDGAAAAVVGPGRGPQILATRSVFLPNTLDVMGWEFTNAGMRLVMSREIPIVIRRHMRDAVDGFLAEHRTRRSDVKHFVIHPGGPRVLEGIEDAFELPRDGLRASREFLRRYGNLSSASVLFILASVLREARPGELGLLAAVGPGFSLEVLLMRF